MTAHCRRGVGGASRNARLALLLLFSSFILHSSSFGAAAGSTNGVAAYRNGDYVTAAKAFSDAAAQQPAAGTFLNLGLAEWQRGRRGDAILAWERALWVDPAYETARENLRFARKTAQLEAPDLAWHEAASTWLPVNAWGLLAGASLWFAIAMLLLPRVLHSRRAAWHQALAAAGFAVFLLCLPALAGVRSRARIGFVLEKETPLRLTPTRDAQTISLLAAGQPARCERVRGGYLFIRTTYGAGWIERDQFGRICP